MRVRSTREVTWKSEVTVQNKLPPDFERLAKLVDEQPPKAREGFQFLLAIALEESGKAELINDIRLPLGPRSV